jgi:hypothetical protein
MVWHARVMVDEAALRRRWTPADEAALESAFGEGSLEEKNWCELKRELPTGKAANVELARDLASLAVDGGTLVIGLDEAAPNGDPLYPVHLQGLRERIEGVAATRVHPPLQLDSSAIPSVADPTRGYVVVHVPASPLAPHQVDGTYYGRGDTGKRRLSDPEAERLFQRRALWAKNADVDLDQWIALKQIERRVEPELYVVARPVASWPDLFRPIVGATNWRQNLEDLQREVLHSDHVREATRRALGETPVLGFEFSSLVTPTKTAGGAGLSSAMVTDSHQDQWVAELEVNESGLVALSVGAIAIMRYDNETKYMAVNGDLVAGAVLEVIVLLSLLSELVNYRSEWDLAIALTKLRGSRPGRLKDPPSALTTSALPAGYALPDYRANARASVLEVARQPGAIVERLLGLYGRATAMTPVMQPIFDIAEPTP